MAFHDVQLPPGISANFVGGPRFSSRIIQLLSGYEQRNQNWQKARGAWSLGYPPNFDQWEELLAFFYARAGAIYGFRFKDWGDYKLGDTLTNARQSIGTGDGAAVDFQLFKRYTSGAYYYDRDLNKIVAGTVRVWVDSSETTAFSVDLLTGIITMDSAPGNTLDVSALCEFDVPVRFNQDDLDVELHALEIGSVPNVSIIELRGE